MSTNHYSQDVQETIWWNTDHRYHPQPPFMQLQDHHHHSKLLNLHPQLNYTTWPYHHLSNNNYLNHPSTATTATATHLDFDLNNRGDDVEDPVGQVLDDSETLLLPKPSNSTPRESMFEKPLTPSDVGKLNRLVIPKQHAEKYFPLSGDSSDKGLLLSFEDESGKCWRFRYSYWSSSQSYVLTKGWSRYVREKRLDAGDIVFFERHRIDGDRLFIGWRRRGVVQDGSAAVAPPGGGGDGGGDWSRGMCGVNNVASRHHTGPAGQNLTVSSGNLKRLRLFGVNLDCQLDDSEPTTPEGSFLSSQGPPNHPHRHPFYPHLHFQDHHNHVDMTLYRDRRG